MALNLTFINLSSTGFTPKLYKVNMPPALFTFSKVPDDHLKPHDTQSLMLHQSTFHNMGNGTYAVELFWHLDDSTDFFGLRVDIPAQFGPFHWGKAPYWTSIAGVTTNGQFERTEVVHSDDSVGQPYAFDQFAEIDIKMTPEADHTYLNMNTTITRKR